MESKIDDIIHAEILLQSLITDIDAFVFNLYDLSRDEIQTILNSLGTGKDARREIVKKLE